MMVIIRVKTIERTQNIGCLHALFPKFINAIIYPFAFIFRLTLKTIAAIPIAIKVYPALKAISTKLNPDEKATAYGVIPSIASLTGYSLAKNPTKRPIQVAISGDAIHCIIRAYP